LNRPRTPEYARNGRIHEPITYIDVGDKSGNKVFPMGTFSARLRHQIELLGISHAEVARRSGLTPRTFGHYVTGTREPNLQTLVRIAKTLNVTPNDLLGLDAMAEDKSDDAVARHRLAAAGQVLTGEALELAVALVATVVERQPKVPNKKK
jgi:transcriptional regulator with XRE-family HTH domain